MDNNNPEQGSSRASTFPASDQLQNIANRNEPDPNLRLNQLTMARSRILTIVQQYRKKLENEVRTQFAAESAALLAEKKMQEQLWQIEKQQREQRESELQQRMDQLEQHIQSAIDERFRQSQGLAAEPNNQA